MAMASPPAAIGGGAGVGNTLLKLRTPAVLVAQNGNSLALPNYLADEAENARASIVAQISSLSRTSHAASAPGQRSFDDEDAVTPDGAEYSASQQGGSSACHSGRSFGNCPGGSRPPSASRPGTGGSPGSKRASGSGLGPPGGHLMPSRRPSAADSYIEPPDRTSNTQGSLPAAAAAAAAAAASSVTSRRRALGVAASASSLAGLGPAAQLTEANLSDSAAGRMIQHYDYDDDSLDEEELESDLAFAQDTLDRALSMAKAVSSPSATAVQPLGAGRGGTGSSSRGGSRGGSGGSCTPLQVVEIEVGSPTSVASTPVSGHDAAQQRQQQQQPFSQQHAGGGSQAQRQRPGSPQQSASGAVRLDVGQAGRAGGPAVGQPGSSPPGSSSLWDPHASSPAQSGAGQGGLASAQAARSGVFSRHSMPTLPAQAGDAEGGGRGAAGGADVEAGTSRSGGVGRFRQEKSPPAAAAGSDADGAGVGRSGSGGTIRGLLKQVGEAGTGWDGWAALNGTGGGAGWEGRGLEGGEGRVVWRHGGTA